MASNCSLWFALSRPSPILCRCRVHSLRSSGYFLPSFVLPSFLLNDRPFRNLLHMVAIKRRAPLLRDIYSHRYLLLVVSSILTSIYQPRLPCSFSVPGHRTSTVEVLLPWSRLSELLLSYGFRDPCPDFDFWLQLDIPLMQCP